MQTKSKKKQPLMPKGGDDAVMTPPELSEAIVRHFRPHGWILEPCFGSGSFLKAAQNCGSLFGYEIQAWPRFDGFDGVEFEDLGYDFLTATNVPKVDWIITNPPWSQIREFMVKSMEVADNIVFLCLINAWYMRARQREIRSHGFGLVEIIEFPVIPKKPWPQAGISLGAGWLRRGWTGSTHIHAVSGS